MAELLVVKEIPLTQGKVAIVDDEDFEFLHLAKWCACRDHSTFYAKRRVRLHAWVVGLRMGCCGLGERISKGMQRMRKEMT
jgi:hypothetical protein